MLPVAPVAVVENTKPAVLKVVVQALATVQLELPVQHFLEFVAATGSPDKLTVAVLPSLAFG
jgi:hypothetical protein